MNFRNNSLGLIAICDLQLVLYVMYIKVVKANLFLANVEYFVLIVVDFPNGPCFNTLTSYL